MGGEAIVDQRKTYTLTDMVDISEDTVNSVGVELMGRPILGLVMPAMNGTTPEVNVEISVDLGSTWFPLLDADGATEAISITASGTAFAVSSDDLSPLAAYCGGEHSYVRVRLTVDTAQTADRTVTWVLCG